MFQLLINLIGALFGLDMDVPSDSSDDFGSGSNSFNSDDQNRDVYGNYQNTDIHGNRTDTDIHGNATKRDIHGNPM